MIKHTEEMVRNIQQRYYEATAASYDQRHLAEPEHEFALTWLTGLIDYYDIRSILDVGSGTGRLLRRLRSIERFSVIKILGIEPIAALREQAYKKGISRNELIPGDGTNLEFANGSFDLVCEFGVLHHLEEPGKAIREMLRVSKQAIFISDSNIYVSGPLVERAAKQALRALKLWRLAQFIKTRGKRYKMSEGDGLWYPYSVYDNYRQIARACKYVHILNTSEQGVNPYRSCGHVALFASKTDMAIRTIA
jgi:SAM-dependent methyltransferase